MPISNFILKLLLYEKICLDCDTLGHGILFDFSRWKFLFGYSYNHIVWKINLRLPTHFKFIWGVCRLIFLFLRNQSKPLYSLLITIVKLFPHGWSEFNFSTSQVCYKPRILMKNYPDRSWHKFKRPSVCQCHSGLYHRTAPQRPSK